MKELLITTGLYLATVITVWIVGYLLTGNFKDTKDFAIGSVAYLALYKSIRQEVIS